MPHTTKIENFELTTYEPLSRERETTLVNAVVQGTIAVREAMRKVFESQSVLLRTNNDLTYLPSDTVLHIKTLLRCDTDQQVAKALLDAGRALTILAKGMSSTDLKFIEWGMDSTSNAMDNITSGLKSLGVQSVPKLYQPGDQAMVRSFTVTGGMFMGAETFEGCLNNGAIAGNPNSIMIKLSAIDKGLKEFTDTVVHESTHKFLGTVDEGMKGGGLSFLENDGLVNYKAQYPGVPLPIETPGFLKMGPTEALGNAYILTGFILAMPRSEPYRWYEIKRQATTGPLGSQTELGGVLRRALASRREQVLHKGLETSQS